MERMVCKYPGSGRGSLFAALGALVLAAAGLAHASGPATFAGAPVAIGDGHARVIVAEGRHGAPTSVSLVISAGALRGLPGHGAGRESWEYILPMPATGPRTGFDHVTLDWNPVGHIPKGVYSVPHFDVHFYVISVVEQHAITFTGADRERLLAPPDGRLVPTGYVVPPETAVEQMGLHGLDPGSPEFHGKPFTYTFLYGYHDGRLIFVEPMISLAYFLEQRDVTVPVRTPAAYSSPAYYPTRYRVGYDASRNEYRVALAGLRPYGTRAAAAD